MSDASPARRPRGRPRDSDGRATAQRLLEAASSVCAEFGFERATLSLIAEQAEVSPTAVYNHFDSREDLLYAAAVRGIQQISQIAASVAAKGDGLRALAEVYLRPELRETRRLVLELEMASGREARLGALFGEWHRTVARQVAASLPEGTSSPQARAKLFFMMLLGLCHVDDLSSVPATPDEVSALATEIVGAVLGD